MRSRRSKAWAALAVGLVVALVAGGCTTDHNTYHEGEGPKVAVIGDSITVRASSRIIDLVDPGNDLYVGAVVGQQWVSMLNVRDTRIMDPKPDVLVVNLGTNVGDSPTAAQMLADADAFLAPFVDDTCIIIATLSAHSAAPFRAPTAEVQQGLIARADIPLRWDIATAAHPEWFDLPGDGVHPLDAGLDAYAMLVDLAVDVCLQSA